MMYRTAKELESFPFLHTAFVELSKKYSIKDIYMDNKGEICITFNKKLTEEEIKDVIQRITPYKVELTELECSVDYRYPDYLKNTTYVFSRDGVDYRNL